MTKRQHFLKWFQITYGHEYNATDSHDTESFIGFMASWQTHRACLMGPEQDSQKAIFEVLRKMDDSEVAQQS
jgi:hypothetical protein